MAELANELDVVAVLGPEGIIGEQVDGFESRASQLAMAELIAEAISLGESKDCYHGIFPTVQFGPVICQSGSSWPKPQQPFPARTWWHVPASAPYQNWW